MISALLNINRRSMENPSTNLSDPDEWFYEAVGATKTTSGVRVNRKTALTYAAIWRGVSMISRDVGKIPLITYKRTADGEGKERDRQHPVYRLLKSKPNAEQRAVTFRQTLTAHAILTGSGFAYIFRRGNGTPLELRPLNPEDTFCVRVNGKLWVCTTVNGELRKLPYEDVHHIKGFSWDGISGLDLIDYAKESIGLGLAANKYAANYYRKSATPNLVVEYPTKIQPDNLRTIRESWDKLYSGLENSHRPAVMDMGAKVHQLSINARDSQLIESRQFEIREIANWLGIPPHKIGDTSRTAYASLEQENQSYLDDALDTWLCEWETEATEKLLTEKEKIEESVTIEALRQALVRADLNARSNYYARALQVGWMNRDEVRARENMSPLPDGTGKEFMTPKNMQVGNQPAPAEPQGSTPPAEGTPPPPAAGGNRAAVEHLRAITKQTLARMVKRLGTAYRRSSRDPSTFLASIDRMEAEHGTTLTEALEPMRRLAESLELSCPDLASSVINNVRAELIEAAGNVGPRDLAATTDNLMSRLETDLPATLTEALTPKEPQE